MNRSFLVFLVLYTLAAAMVPRQRRAVTTEENGNTTVKVKICAPQTPCAWSFYKQITKIIDTNITNSYCVCAIDTVCIITEDDWSSNSYIHRCRLPVEDDETTESFQTSLHER